MAQKNIKDLSIGDLGKHAVYKETNGDRSSGAITAMTAVRSGESWHINITIGNAILTVDANETLELTD